MDVHVCVATSDLLYTVQPPYIDHAQIEFSSCYREVTVMRRLLRGF